ncbi:hypothetical protein [Ideonella sp. YS5]|uniref:hypothetical protein n=1 Tax=Ideonella sp. YS5 TaxID=3453714 RepID=UPI003EEF9A87
MFEMASARTAARRRLWCASRTAAMMLMVALSACGGGGSSSDPAPPPAPPPPQPVTMDVTASSDSALAGSGAITLHAQVGGSSDVPAWTLEGPGTLSATSGNDVQYVPPDTEHLDDPATATVTAVLSGSLQRHVQIALSPVEVPGHHWTTVRPSAPYFSSVAYGNGRYVATTYSNAMWSSADGKAWTQTTLIGDSSAQYNDAVWGDKGWVAVATDGSVATSADGLAWAAQSEKLSPGVYRLVVGNQTYVAYADVANAMASSDGRHWVDTGKVWSDLAFGNGVFMGVADREVPYRSSDAHHWTAVTDPGTFYGLAFANGGFSTDQGNFHVQSPDGTTWISTAQSNLDGVIAGAGTTLFELDDRDMGVQLAGQFWQRVALDVPFAQPRAVAYGQAGYVGVSTLGWISSSANALEWITRVEGSYGTLQAVVDFNGQYIAASRLGWILRSTDAQQWVAARLPVTDDERSVSVDAMAHGQGVLVATGCISREGCGVVGGTNPGMWMRSTDGVTWSFAVTPAPNETIGGVVHDGQRFVAVGAAGNVYASTDGNLWARTASLAGAPPLKGIAYGGGKYVVIGPLGDIAYSSNGTSWTNSPGIPGVDGQGRAILRPLAGLAWDGRQFVGVGDGGLKATSPDGRVWTVSTEANQGGGWAVAACNGQIVSVGPQVAESSLDGLSWRSRQTASSPQLNAVTCGRGRFVAVGWESSIAVSDH